MTWFIFGFGCVIGCLVGLLIAGLCIASRDDRDTRQGRYDNGSPNRIMDQNDQNPK